MVQAGAELLGGGNLEGQVHEPVEDGHVGVDGLDGQVEQEDSHVGSGIAAAPVVCPRVRLLLGSSDIFPVSAVCWGRVARSCIPRSPEVCQHPCLNVGLPSPVVCW